MSGFDTVDFFTDGSLVDDPYPYFEHLRATRPVARLPHHGVVAVTGYDESSELWRDPATFSSCNSVTGPFPGLPVGCSSVPRIPSRASVRSGRSRSIRSRSCSRRPPPTSRSAGASPARTC